MRTKSINLFEFLKPSLLTCKSMAISRALKGNAEESKSHKQDGFIQKPGLKDRESDNTLLFLSGQQRPVGGGVFPGSLWGGTVVST